MFSAGPLSRRERIGIAVLIGVGAMALSFTVLRLYPQFVARDYTYSWRAARALLAGQNPYAVIRPAGPYPFEEYYFYPLPAALITLPFAGLPAVPSAALFVGVTSAVLAYAVTRDGFRGLLIFVGVPYLAAAVLGQLTPLVVAAAFLPAFQWAYAAKPTIGAALFAARPSLRGAALAVLLVAVSLIVRPHWPGDWLETLRHTPHHRPPILRPFGFIVLLALLRWRRPEGRLLAVMAIAPQVFYFYDQLPLALVARTGRQALALAALSWVGWAITWTTCTHKPMCVEFGEPWILPLLYLPALVLVLRRPNHEVASDLQPSRHPNEEIASGLRPSQ
jgi:hypothetical protein